MQIDLQTVALKPLRNTFKHIARRFGDKVATRYQEATYDLQPTHNFHYRPTWDPSRELHDVTRTKIVLKDWYVLKDPRQFYYGTYTQARARQQDAIEKNFDFIEERGLELSLNPEIKEIALKTLMPLRHVAWGANMNNCGMAAYAYGTALNQACTFASFDHLGIAQYLTRVGLAIGDVEDLKTGKADWEKDANWQPLRQYVEKTLVTRDVMELFVAQNFALDGLLYPLIYKEAVDGVWAAKSGPTIGMMTVFMADWQAETAKWVDSVLKTTAAESVENKALLTQWTNDWAKQAKAALTPVAKIALGAEADAAMADVALALQERAKKIGIELNF
jgi:phenol/toluene 2-monooxygenase (NADH) P1/A1